MGGPRSVCEENPGVENTTAGMPTWFSDESNIAMKAVAATAELTPALACVQHCMGQSFA